MQRKRFKLGKAAAIAAAGAIVSQPTAATADDFAFSVGVFLDFTIGATWNVGIGLDTRATYLFEGGSCLEDVAQSGMGAYAQGLFLIHGATARVSAGLHGGYQPKRSGPALDFEAGWMWQGQVGAQPGGHGLQLGALASLVPFDGAVRFNLYDDGTGWVPEGHLAVGGRFPGPFGSDGSFCAEGRPQRNGEGLCLGRVFVRGGRFKRRGGGAARQVAGVHWAEAARAEAASVPAFLALARDLRRAGAPERLVKRALLAASDEVRHARTCAAMASRKLGRQVAVEVPRVAAPRAGEDHVGLLTRLAVESWKDGCIGEGSAAQRAVVEARLVRDRREKQGLQTIAREEASHAGLAWDVVRWASEAGGTTVRAAVAKAVSDSGTPPAAAFGASRGRTSLSADAKAQIHAAVTAAATTRWQREG